MFVHGVIAGILGGLLVARIARHHHRFHAGHCAGGWRGHRGPRGRHRGFGRGRGPLGGLYHLLAELDASPAQEKAIRQEVERVRGKLGELREEKGRTRADLARAVRGESYDEEALADLFVRHDDLLRGLREELAGALGRVHVVLDEDQRARLAGILERGRPRGFGGPYRTM